jgi:thiosulfate/3-mercaptopyruvate sulfurtransferase
MVDQGTEEALAELPPSAKLVYKVLEYRGRLSQTRLVEETRLSDRTLRYAITQLEEAGLVESRSALYDARRTCYSLVGASGESRHARNALVEPERVAERLSSFERNDPTDRLAYVTNGEPVETVVPGSVVVDLDSSALDPNRQRLPDRGELASALGERGVTEETNLVLYDDGRAYYAAYLYWILTYYGHRGHRLLDGGLDYWRDGTRPTADAPATVDRVEYAVRGEFGHVRAHRDDVIRALTQETVLLDVRDASEYRGEAGDGNELAASARSQGHIPGAANVPQNRLFDEDGRFAPRSDLEEVFVAADVTTDRQVIVYCGVGARSALGWFVLSELLGYPEVMNYDGSWTEWGNLVDVPVETE